jgi:hypothetical protein
VKPLELTAMEHRTAPHKTHIIGGLLTVPTLEDLAGVLATAPVPLADIPHKRDLPGKEGAEERKAFNDYIKEGTALIAGHLPEGMARMKDNMHSMSSLVVDIDNMTPERYEAIKKQLEEGSLTWLYHETSSHLQPGKGCRIRLWLPFAAPLLLEGVDWPPTRAAMLQKLGFAADQDTQCSDASRLYYTTRCLEGESRVVDCCDTGECLDPTPFIVRRAALIAAAQTAPRAPEGQGIPIDRVELCDRWLGQCGSKYSDFVRRVKACAPIGADHSGRRALYLGGGASLMGVLKPEEDTATVRWALFHPCWEADCRLDPAGAYPWSDIEDMFTDDMREKYNPEGVAAYRAARAVEAAAARASTDRAIDRARTLEVEAHEARRKVLASKSPEAQAQGVPEEPLDPDVQATEDLKKGTQAFYKAYPDPIFNSAEEGIQAFSRFYYRYDSAAEAQQKRSAALVTAQGSLTQCDYTHIKTILNDYQYWDGEGKDRKLRQLAPLWWTSRKVRTYDTVVIKSPCGSEAANEINLWRGFGIVKKQGATEYMRTLILSLAGGDARAAEYLWNWCAWAVQHPTELAEVAPALKGEEGCGKSTLTWAMRKIFGPHGKSVSRSADVIGDYTHQTAGAGFIAGEELRFEAKELGSLYDLLTNKTRLVAGKFINSFNVTNAIKLMITTNADFVIKSPGLMRRFFVVRCGSLHPQAPGQEGLDNVAWWDDFYSWLEYEDGRNDNPRRNPKGWAGEGLSYWLQALLDTDLSTFVMRNVPQTAAKLEERAEGQSAAVQWWISVLRLGVGATGAAAATCPLKAREGCIEAKPPDLEAHNIEWVSKHSKELPLTPKRIGTYMRAWGCAVPVPHTNTGNVYRWPSLEAAREALARERKIPEEELMGL